MVIHLYRALYRCRNYRDTDQKYVSIVMYRYCSVSPREGKSIHLYRDTSARRLYSISFLVTEINGVAWPFCLVLLLPPPFDKGLVEPPWPPELDLAVPWTRKPGPSVV